MPVHKLLSEIHVTLIWSVFSVATIGLKFKQGKFSALMACVLLRSMYSVLSPTADYWDQKSRNWNAK